MSRSDFSYELPEALIAQHPLPERSASRMLVVRRGSAGCEDARVDRLAEYLRSGDLLVFNDTRVIAARLAARKATGGRVEIMIERIVDARNALAQIRASKSPKPDSLLWLDESRSLRVVGRERDLFHLCCESGDWRELLDRFGQIPLPPYIDRQPAEQDLQRYQTVYACQDGAVAAPTAGLHFDEELLRTLHEAGVQSAYVTLHVGAGTFQPVRCENLDDHPMHAERALLGAAAVAQIDAARRAGGRVIAVGTTSVRVLESAARNGVLAPFDGETRLFIRPGFGFRVVDGLLTNFHLPESTLLMLVAAFHGYRQTLDAYRHAVRQGYRFFSYGDSMLILPDDSAAGAAGAG